MRSALIRNEIARKSAGTAGEPQFSEGRGHRFESCRVRQFLLLCLHRLDCIASVWKGSAWRMSALLALISIAMIGYLYGCKTTDDR